MQLSLLRTAFGERPAQRPVSIRPASGQYPVSVPMPPDQRPPDALMLTVQRTIRCRPTSAQRQDLLRVGCGG
jgi:hypothetical protein